MIKKEEDMFYFTEKRLKNGKIVLLAREGYDVEREIIPNALKYINESAWNKEVLLIGLRGIDIPIYPQDKLSSALERYREELYRYSGLEL